MENTNKTLISANITSNFNKQNQKPSDIDVFDSVTNERLVNGTDYKLSYKGDFTDIGESLISVKGISEYQGSNLEVLYIIEKGLIREPYLIIKKFKYIGSKIDVCGTLNANIRNYDESLFKIVSETSYTEKGNYKLELEIIDDNYAWADGFNGTLEWKIYKDLKYYATNNFVLTIDNLYVNIFKFIKIRKTNRRREAFFGFLFILLWLIGFAVFTGYPLINSFIISLNKAYYNMETGLNMTFTGFDNYINVIRDNTLLPLYTAHIGKLLISVPLIVVFAIIISVLVNNPIKLKGFWRVVFFLPVVISTGPVINELTAQGATTLPSLTESGVFEYISENMGEWLASPLELVLNSMLSILWYAGIPILIFLAGLQKVDDSIYEAASIDGASPWDRFWKITLPSIKSLIGVSIIYIVVSISLFVETGGILENIKIHMLSGAPDSKQWFGYGYAAAASWIYFIIMVLVMGVYYGLVSIRRRDKA